MANEKQTQSKAPVAATVEKKLDPKAEAKKAERKAARSRILNFLKDNSEKLGPLAKDIQMFIGSGAGRTVGAVKSVNSDLRAAFLAAGTKGLSEMEIFKSFKIGRPEMVTKIRILVLCPNTNDRVWVKFNEATETYHVVGQGTNPPKDWDGYIPSKKDAL
jgi:hypothetical protein